MEQRVRHELNRLVHSNTGLTSSAVNIAVASALAFALRGLAPTAHLAGFVAAMVLVMALRLVLRRAYIRADPDGRDAVRWDRIFTAVSALHGGAWGIGCAVIYPDTDTMEEILVPATLAGVNAAAMAAQAPMPHRYYAFLAASMVPLMARLMTIGDQAHVAFAVMGAVYVAIMASLARHTHASLREGVELRFQKDALVTALRDSGERLRAILEAVPVPISITRASDSAVLFINEAGRSLLLGGKEGGGSIAANAYVDPEDRDRLLAALANGPVRDLEVQVRNHRGRRLWVLMSAILIEYQGESAVLAALLDISQRRKTEDALKQAKRDAEAAAQAKSNFLAVMSHEIRTPIHGWQGLTELLERTPLDRRQRRYVDLLRRTARDLESLLTRILDFSRLEAGRVQLDHKPFRLAPVIDSVSGLIRPLAEEKGLTLQVALDRHLPQRIRGDAQALGHILTNLLDNAVKFTEQGIVRLDVTTEDSGARAWLVCEVSDTGIGIDPEATDELFSPFTQVDGSPTRRAGGSGMGLAISRRLAMLMDGTLEAGGALGRGSTFRLSLPLDPAADDGREGEDDDERFEGIGADLPALHILVVDDSDLNRIVVREMLAGTRVRVDEAADGRQAVDRAAAIRYDAILMDVRMPGMDGFEATRTIRRQEQDRDQPPVPIIAVTAGHLDGKRQGASDAGCTEILGKPISWNDLVNTLRRHANAAGPPHPTPVQGSPPLPDPDGLEAAFVARLRDDAAELRRNIDHGNATEIADIAHRMRGHAAVLGANDLAQALAALEHHVLQDGGHQGLISYTEAVECAMKALDNNRPITSGSGARGT